MTIRSHFLTRTIMNSTEIHEKSFRIKHEDERFFTRILSKESSKSQPSFRVYYGDVSSAVPFTWETIPGTPKHASLGENSHIPPLTPPPSYHTNTSSNNLMNSNKSSGSKPQLILRSLIRRVTRPKKRVHVAAYPSSTSSSLSSLSWSYERSSFAGKRRSRRFYSWGSSFDHERAMDNIDHQRSEDQMKSYESEKIHHGGYYRSVKKALFSVLGRRSD